MNGPDQALAVDSGLEGRWVRDETGTIFKLSGRFRTLKTGARKYVALRPHDEGRAYWLDNRRWHLQTDMTCAECGYGFMCDEDNPDFLCKVCREG